MEAFKDLFTFPIILVDGENEERKRKNNEIIGDNDRPDYDVAKGEAQYPYYDFRGVEDRWLPTEESFQRALEGKFDACLVTFLHTPQMLVPWPKNKFKDKIALFFHQREEETEKEAKDQTSTITSFEMTPEQVDKIMGILKPKEDGNKGE